MSCPLCNDTGEQRYWEGRWRDEKSLNAKLLACLQGLLNDDDVIQHLKMDTIVRITAAISEATSVS